MVAQAAVPGPLDAKPLPVAGTPPCLLSALARPDGLIELMLPGGVVVRRMRLAKRYAASWAKAVLTYP